MDAAHDTAVALALALPLLAACLTDLRHRLIPDWTVLAVAGVGLVAAVAEQRPAAALAAGLVGLAAGSLLARTRAWGQGDAKLLGAAGLAAGGGGLAPFLLGTAVAGGLLAGLLLMLRAPVRAGRLALPAGAPRWLRAEQSRLRRAPSVPYALAIAAGLAAARAPALLSSPGV